MRGLVVVVLFVCTACVDTSLPPSALGCAVSNGVADRSKAISLESVRAGFGKDVNPRSQPCPRARGSPTSSTSSCDTRHTLALGSDGLATHATQTPSVVPVQVQVLSNVARVGAGGDTSLASTVVADA